MKMRFLLIVLTVCPLFANTQDTIVLTTGVKIPCKVTKVDSLYVYYDLTGKKSVRHTAVGSTYVQVIHYYDQLTGGESPGGTPKKKHGNCISFSGGVSMAAGIFSNDDVNSDEDGFAGNGFNVNFTLAHQFRPFFGIAVKAFYNTNKFKVENLVDSLESLYNASVTTNKVNYNTIGGVAGPLFTIPVDRLSIRGGFSIGYENIRIPETSYMITNGVQSGYIIVSKRSGDALIFDAMAGLTYSVNTNWELSANVDYLFGNCKVGDYTCKYGDGSVVTFTSYKQKYEVFNISVGLGLKF
jgi:hypothetical protein